MRRSAGQGRKEEEGAPVDEGLVLLEYLGFVRLVTQDKKHGTVVTHQDEPVN